MSLQKTEAIILRSLKQGETSKILTLYTRAHGKLGVIAKGARSGKSRFGGVLEPLNYVSIVYYEKESRDLQTLSQADIINSFPGIRKYLGATSLASATCELVNQLETAGDANPSLFHLHLRVLEALDREPPQPLTIFHAFEIKLLALLGFQPDFSGCLQCARTPNGDVTVSLKQGGYFCRRCRPAGQGMTLSQETVAAVQHFQQRPFVQIAALTFPKAARHQMNEFLTAYLQHHLEGFRELRALKFFKNLQNNLSHVAS